MALSRRDVARYAARQLVAGDDIAVLVQQVSSYVIATKSQRTIELLVADIERCIADEYSHLSLSIESAYELSDALKKEVAGAFGEYKSYEIKNSINPDLIGGVIAKTADQTLDTSTIGYIKKLKTAL